MAVLGLLPGSWANNSRNADLHNYRNPMQAELYSAGSPSGNGVNPHDTTAFRYLVNLGGAWIDAWRTPGSTAKVWFCHHLNKVEEDTQYTDEYYWFYCHHDPDTWGGGPVTGAVQVRVLEIASGQYRLRLRQYDGSNWAVIGSDFPGAGDSPSYLSLGDDYYLTVELDMSGGTGNHTISAWVGDASAMMNSGNPYVNGAAAAVDIVVSGTPCIYNKYYGGGKSPGTNTMDCGEVFAYDDDTSGSPSSRQDYYGAASCPHAFTMMPVADSDAAGEDDWAAQNNESACSSDEWRAVDDILDAAKQSNDHIKVSGDGSNVDQLFDLNDDWHDPAQTPTVYGLMMAGNSYELAVDKRPSAGLAYCVGEGAPVAYTIMSAGSGYDNWIMTDPLHQTPGGNAWTHDKLNALRIGVRNSTASSEQRVNILNAFVLGTYLQVPADNTACPASFRPRVMQY